MRNLFIIFSCLLLLSCGNNSTNQNLSNDKVKPGKDTVSIATDSLHSEITCPKCGFKKVELLPTDYCLLNYKCSACLYNIEPKESDCCVFCSYGDKKCPSKQ